MKNVSNMNVDRDQYIIIEDYELNGTVIQGVTIYVRWYTIINI